MVIFSNSIKIFFVFLQPGAVGAAEIVVVTEGVAEIEIVEAEIWVAAGMFFFIYFYSRGFLKT